MKILIRNIDSIVIYAENVLNFVDGHLEGSGWMDNNFNSLNSKIVEVESLPTFFTGGAYYYNGDFVIANKELFDSYSSSELAKIKDAKCKEIDTATANAIIDLAGDVYSQANKQAKSLQLIRKEALGAITAEEKELLDYFNNLFLQIEALIVSGNDKEAQIQACTTLAEYEDKCVELGV